MSLWLELLLTFMMIGISAFGGGYAVMPLIQKYVVDGTGWISLMELADITSISQMTPGPIMINAATFVGIKTAGLLGGLIATLGAILPSFFLVWILAVIFERHGKLTFIQNIMKGLRPTIVGLIYVAALTLFQASLFKPGALSLSSIEWPAMIAFGVVLGLSLKTKLDTMILIGLGGLLGLVFFWL